MDHNMLLIKVFWYVLRVKNMHSESPSDPLGSMRKAEIHALRYFLRQSRSAFIKLTSMFHHLPNVDPKHFCVLAPTNRVLPSLHYFNLNSTQYVEQECTRKSEPVDRTFEERKRIFSRYKTCAFGNHRQWKIESTSQAAWPNWLSLQVVDLYPLFSKNLLNLT